MPVLRLDQFWECPECGSQVAAGEPAQLGPPRCSFGHSPVEMEQKTADAFGSRDAA